MIGTLNASVMEWHLELLQHFQMYQGTMLQTVKFKNNMTSFFVLLNEVENEFIYFLDITHYRGTWLNIEGLSQQTTLWTGNSRGNPQGTPLHTTLQFFLYQTNKTEISQYSSGQTADCQDSVVSNSHVPITCSTGHMNLKHQNKKFNDCNRPQGMIARNKAKTTIENNKHSIKNVSNYYMNMSTF